MSACAYHDADMGAVGSAMKGRNPLAFTQTPFYSIWNSHRICADPFPSESNARSTLFRAIAKPTRDLNHPKHPEPTLDLHPTLIHPQPSTLNQPQTNPRPTLKALGERVKVRYTVLPQAPLLVDPTISGKLRLLPNEQARGECISCPTPPMRTSGPSNWTNSWALRNNPI